MPSRLSNPKDKLFDLKPDAVTVRGPKIAIEDIDDSWDDATRLDRDGPAGAPKPPRDAADATLQSPLGVAPKRALSESSAMGDAFDVVDDAQEEITLNPNFADATIVATGEHDVPISENEAPTGSFSAAFDAAFAPGQESTESSVRDRVPLGAEEGTDAEVTGSEVTGGNALAMPVGRGALMPFDDSVSTGGTEDEWSIGDDEMNETGPTVPKLAKKTVAARPPDSPRPNAPSRKASAPNPPTAKSLVEALKSPVPAKVSSSPPPAPRPASKPATEKSRPPPAEPIAKSAHAPSGPFAVESTELDLDLWATAKGTTGPQQLDVVEGTPRDPFAFADVDPNHASRWNDEIVPEPAPTAPHAIGEKPRAQLFRDPASGPDSLIPELDGADFELEFKSGQHPAIGNETRPAAATPSRELQDALARAVEHGPKPKPTPAAAEKPPPLPKRSLRVQPATPDSILMPEPLPIDPRGERKDSGPGTFARFGNMKVSKSKESHSMPPLRNALLQGTGGRPTAGRDPTELEEPPRASGKWKWVVLSLLLAIGALLGYVVTMYYTGGLKLPH